MIYTLTLNPAIDRELTVAEVQFDSVLSALKSQVDFGVCLFGEHHVKAANSVYPNAALR